MKAIKTITKHNWFLRLIKKIIRTVRKTPELVLHDDNLPEKAIYYANHSGAAGPLTLSVYFPKYLVPWGAYPMTGHYFSRWKYLYFTFYRQKLGYKKFRSFMLATLFGLISKILYQGVRLIPTYPDTRLRKTINESLEHLKVNNSILIFPEDSSSGYAEEIEAFHAGFVYLAQQYFKKNNKHIPMIPLFYHKAKQQIITGKTKYLSDFEANLNREEIAESLRKSLNELGL
jgi:1-acyl-sn-glycerol-3-phosphate acyltransferase